jgi:hypothetical protein
VKFFPEVMLVLSVPAGIVGFVVGSRIVAALSMPADISGIVELLGPLLLGGLFMLPFVVPFFDRMAKRDLAAHRREVEAEAGPADPGGD